MVTTALIASIAITATGCFLLLILQGLRLNAAWPFTLALFFNLVAAALASVGVVDGLVPLLVGVSGLFILGAVLSRPSASHSLLTPPIIILILFTAYATLSLVWSESPSTGWDKMLIFITRGLLPGLATLMAFRAFWSWSWRPFLLLGATYTVVLLAIGPSETSSGVRASLETGNPIWDARAVLLFASVALASSLRPVWLRYAIVIAAVIAAASTGSRGPLLAFVLAWLVVALGRLPLKRTWLGWRAAAGLLIAIVVMVTTFLAFPQGRGQLTLLSNSRIIEETGAALVGEDENTKARQHLVASAVPRAPMEWLFGAGVGSLDLRLGVYPHNLPAELLAEVGLLGLSLWLTALWLAWRRSLLLLRVLLVQTVLFSLTSGNLASNFHPVVVMCLAVGFLERSNIRAL